MTNEIELIKVRAERDEAIKAWGVSCEDVKLLMAEVEEIKSALMLLVYIADVAPNLEQAGTIKHAKGLLNPLHPPRAGQSKEGYQRLRCLLRSAEKALEPVDKPLCLVGVGGDCGPGGMNDKPVVLPFYRKHESIVREFLHAQLAWQLTMHFDKVAHSKHYRALALAADALEARGIFEHKWHKRTQWDLGFTEEHLSED